MSIKAKQVAGVTTLVVVIVAILSAYHLATLASFLLQETASRAELLSGAIYQRAFEISRNQPPDLAAALRDDGGIRSILTASLATENINYAAVVDSDRLAIAHAFPGREGVPLPPQPDFAELVQAPRLEQLLAIYRDNTYETRKPLLVGDQQFGSICISVSTLLVRSGLRDAFRNTMTIVIAALVVSSVVAMLLAQWLLRPIHIIQSSLSRLGRGELDVRLDLPEQEFRDLGTSFDAVTAQLAALGKGAQEEDGTVRARTGADYQSVMENLEDAVALFSPRGEVIFSNAAMRALGITELPESHPVRQLVDRTLNTRSSAGPLSLTFPRQAGVDSGSWQTSPSDAPRSVGEGQQGAEPDTEAERLLMCHAIEDTNGRFLGAMLVARNLGYLNQVHSTLNYSRKAAALGRLLAGVAHEVKNPLNAMTIHLELLKQKLGSVRDPIVVPGTGEGPGKPLDLVKHVNIIGSEIKRLDEVVAGFLKFARPDELKLQPVRLDAVIRDVIMTITPEAHRRGVAIREECPTLPDINADQGMLTQAVLNLAINALQAMPDGGSLRLGCRVASRGRVELVVEDTGVGIAPENLPRIFDLYFTTKDKGSGIGLSMVFRIVQLHDGEVEVQSTPGHGTMFRLIFPPANPKEHGRGRGARAGAPQELARS